MGRGRPWPLLTGERGHYEIACGKDPLPLLEAMARMASPGGMLPEQVWDGPPIPQRGLEPGRPTGSAMPLAWTHAEYLKLAASRALGRAFDRPAAVWQRYHGERCRPRVRSGPNMPRSASSPPAPRSSSRCAPRRACDGESMVGRISRSATTPNSLGLHVITIDTSRLTAGQSVDFTFRYSAGDRWVGADYRIEVKSAG